MPARHRTTSSGPAAPPSLPTSPGHSKRPGRPPDRRPGAPRSQHRSWTVPLAVPSGSRPRTEPPRGRQPSVRSQPSALPRRPYRRRAAPGPPPESRVGCGRSRSSALPALRGGAAPLRARAGRGNRGCPWEAETALAWWKRCSAISSASPCYQRGFHQKSKAHGLGSPWKEAQLKAGGGSRSFSAWRWPSFVLGVLQHLAASQSPPSSNCNSSSAGFKHSSCS